ncbi:unnamed protein product [Zymoseptoria tritici ST99CH_1A5]|uniref:Uncharacterized protein n=1 Tax=Zymoseptoria tritici ST99CH_1A5 TaxID=1276529 RepID=A0A1Y6LA43_ZYMTR|nr:unnamed protein product [Zymoseptoria tritici ST99CH_1A5]
MTTVSGYSAPTGYFRDSTTVSWSTANLTTSFTPPPSCFESTYTQGQDSISLMDVKPPDGPTTTYYQVTRSVASECYPDDFAYNTAQSRPGTSLASYYSPGLCPKWYEAALQATSDGTTTTFCCPSQMFLGDYSSTEGGLDLGRSVCYTQQYWSGFAIVSDGVTSSFTASATSGGNAIAQVTAAAIMIINAPRDAALLAELTGTPSSTTATAMPAPALTTGAKAGVGLGVGVSVVSLAIGGLGVYLWRRRRKAKSSAHEAEGGDGILIEKPELDGKGRDVHELDADGNRLFEVDPTAKAAELETTSGSAELDADGSRLFEADSTAKPAELETSGGRAELEGEWRGWEAGEHR